MRGSSESIAAVVGWWSLLVPAPPGCLAQPSLAQAALIAEFAVAERVAGLLCQVWAWAGAGGGPRRGPRQQHPLEPLSRNFLTILSNRAPGISLPQNQDPHPFCGKVGPYPGKDPKQSIFYKGEVRCTAVPTAVGTGLFSKFTCEHSIWVSTTFSNNIKGMTDTAVVDYLGTIMIQFQF